MSPYTFYVFLNEGPTQMWEYKPGDPLREVTVLTVEGETVFDALEVLWKIGNKMDADLHGNEYPSTERSLCTGDVAYTGGGGDVPYNGAYYVVEHVGWARIEEPVRA